MDLDSLEEEYRICQPILQKFIDALENEILQLLIENDVALGVPMESRLKSWTSLAEKLDRRSLDLRSIKDLTNLIGLRLILLFQRDIATTCHLIEKAFRIISKEDTAERLSETQFGYQSLHYIVAMPKEWLAVPSMKEFAGLKAEIQVRTLAQHIWAAASHKLQYKLEQSVPVPLRRSIHRVSALLETVDLEFERVLKQRDDYNSVSESRDSDDVLNVNLLEKILNEELPPANRKDEEKYSDLLNDLLYFDIATEEKLRRLIRGHLDTLVQEDREMVATRTLQNIPPDERARVDRGVYFSLVGLTRSALNKEFGDAWDVYRGRVPPS